MNLVLRPAAVTPLAAAVVITYNPQAGTSTVTVVGGSTWTSPEPLGMVGACSTGCLFAWSGSVRVTVRRAHPAAAPRQVAA